MLHIPPYKQCCLLLDDMNMPAHIQAHSRMVRQVALLLADGLILAGIDINRDLVSASALLHDITKPRSFITGEKHAQTGGEYLRQLGYCEVGEIIRQHVVLDAYFAGDTPSEAEVVNYADKRVLHDKIVSLQERMQYIMDRYAKTEAYKKRFQHVWQQTRRLEERLFAYLVFEPDHVALRLSESTAGSRDEKQAPVSPGDRMTSL